MALEFIKKALEAEKNRRLAEMEDEVSRDMAELERLLLKYNLKLADDSSQPESAITKVESAKPPERLTIASLVAAYRTDPRSPYRNLKPKVRDNYDSAINRIVTEIGHMPADEISAEFVQAYYQQWVAGGKIAMGHSMVTKLRLLASFGVTVLNNDACVRLSLILNRLNFPLPPSRDKISLTPDQIDAVRQRAHFTHRPSLALAQALQYDLELPQRLVIGEWVSALAPGDSDIMVNELKWINGVRWDQVDSELRLQVKTDGEVQVFRLKDTPMVAEEIIRTYQGNPPKTGPMVVNEFTGLPYTSVEYRRWWRKLAEEVGLPKHFRNYDVSKGNRQQEDA